MIRSEGGVERAHRAFCCGILLLAALVVTARAAVDFSLLTLYRNASVFWRQWRRLHYDNTRECRIRGGQGQPSIHAVHVSPRATTHMLTAGLLLLSTFALVCSLYQPC